MIERRPLGALLAHFILIVGIVMLGANIVLMYLLAFRF